MKNSSQSSDAPLVIILLYEYQKRDGGRLIARRGEIPGLEFYFFQ